MNLPIQAWRTVAWREGTNAELRGRFAALRVRAAHRSPGSQMRAEEWLLIEWPEGDKEPVVKYFLSTAPEYASLEQLVLVAKMRWRIERDYQDLKQDFGLGHFEGRGWRGFHHHATLSIAAYGFLMAQRLTMGSSEAEIKKLRPAPGACRSRRFRAPGQPGASSAMCRTRSRRCAFSLALSSFASWDTARIAMHSLSN
jgi:SRSO17 transposase